MKMCISPFFKKINWVRVLMATGATLFMLTAHAEPNELKDFWSTGTNFAYYGLTTAPNEYDVELFTSFTGLHSDPKIFSLAELLFANLGIAKRVDLTFYIPYKFNYANDHWVSRFSDVSADLGIQLLTSPDNNALPNARFILEEVFPNGKFEELDPKLFSADGIGIGAYQTGLGISLQQTYLLPNQHHLNLYLNYLYYWPSNVQIHNLNVYGGDMGTNGVVHPGNSQYSDLAFEYQLTKHWVLATDLLYTSQEENTFTGETKAPVGSPASGVLSLSPQIEYNFNQSWGIIANIWFPLYQRNESGFISGGFAINYNGFR